MSTQSIGRGITLTPAKKGVQVTLEDYIQRKYSLTPENYSSRVKMLLGRIEQYIKDMREGQLVNREAMIKNQGMFLQTLLGVLDSEPTDALVAWDMVLFMAKKHRDDLFNDRSAMRFYNHLPEANQRLFLSLMTLILGTADTRLRVNTLKTFPLESVTVLLRNEKQKSNLIAFYAANV